MGFSLMSQADDIRQFVIDNYVTPARARGDTQIDVKAGNVHREMGLANALPAVCGAIGSNKFNAAAGVSLIGREGPENSSTTTFNFALEGPGMLNVSSAEKILRSRYGDTEIDSDKIVSFLLPDGRAIALQRDIKAVQLWLETDNRPIPADWEFELYPASRSRHSNLPGRLKHNPSDFLRQHGFPKEVVSVRVGSAASLEDLLNWYDQNYLLDRAALNELKKVFTTRFPDFEGLNFGADRGGYWEEERRYKQHLIARANEILTQARDKTDAELGSELFELLNSKESNLLGWRMSNRLREVRGSSASIIDEAAGALVRSPLNPALATQDFVRKIWPIYSDGQAGNMPYRDMRTIPTALLALAAPERAIVVRYQPIFTVGMRLLHRSLIKNAPFSAYEYRDILTLSEEIAKVMRDEWKWSPRDLWDVQGFIWTTCNGAEKENDSDSQEDALSVEPSHTSTRPINRILYGPPGTGKTYATAREAVILCNGNASEDPKELRREYDRLVASGRIEFVTFHQSFSYEEFVEGLRPHQGNEDSFGSDQVPSENRTAQTSAGFRLVPEPGIFRRIARRAQTSTGPGNSQFKIGDRQVFKMSIGEASNPDDAHLFEEALQRNYTLLGFGDLDWTDSRYEKREEFIEAWKRAYPEDPEPNAMSGRVQCPFIFRNSMKEGDLIVVSKGNSLFRAIGVVTGEYQYSPRENGDYSHRRSVRWLWTDKSGVPVEEIYARGFSMRSIYLLAREDLNVPALERYIASQQPNAGGVPESFVLIIDEINRANISKVFGELITLLEPDKRLGAENELKLRLPYSREIFGVPANLHIVGTMNTADRSIALLDTALRRRFEFRELMPIPAVLLEAAKRTQINLAKMLAVLNERIEYLFDREHQIGHAYFVNCESKSDVDIVMRNKVIPLLAEYFYEDWAKVAIVLGDTGAAGQFLERSTLVAPSGMNAEETGEERYRWTVKEPFSDSCYDQFR